MLRFYITPNMGIPVIQRWQNGHWIFDRWPTDEEIREEKILKDRLSPSETLNEIICIRDEREITNLKYNINKAKELDNRSKHITWSTMTQDLRFPLITDSRVYPVDTYTHSHKYLVTQMELDSFATQGDKGTDHTWVGSDYDGGYCPRRCRCPCCGRSY